MHAKRTALSLLFIFALACVAYVNADHQEFYFDSGMNHIVNDLHKDLKGALRFLWGAPLKPSTYPLTRFTFALNYACNQALGLDGFDVTGFLVFNVAIHALNACLVFLLIRAMLRASGMTAELARGGTRATPTGPSFADLWIPLAAAALFAVHPMQASSVAYIMQRRGSLATLFWLLAVLAYLRVRGRAACSSSRAPSSATELSVSPKTHTVTRLLLMAAIPLCYWLSYRSKTLGLPLPLAILAIEFCLRAGDRPALRRFLIVLVPVALLSVASMFLYLWSIGHFNPRTLAITIPDQRVTWSPWTHFLTESRVFWHYWKLLLLPLPRWSCIDHGFALSTSWGEHGALIAVAGHVLLLALAGWAACRGYVLAAAGVFWFYIALIPYIVLAQVELLVEYKTYLPSVGLMLIVAEVLWRLRARVTLKVQVPVVGVLAAVLLATTISRNKIYQNAVNLWTDAIAKSPDNPRPYYILASEMHKRKNDAEAVRLYKKTLELNPQYEKARDNLNNLMVLQETNATAVDRYTQVLQNNPNDANAHNNLAIALALAGKITEAAQHSAEAVRLKPDDPELRNNLALYLAEFGQIDEAIEQYNESLRLRPDNPDTLNNLGIMLARHGKLDEAIAYLSKALELRPRDAETNNNLGNAWLSRGDAERAIGYYRKAIRINANHSAAYKNLGIALARQGRLDEAIDAHRQAIRLEPNQARLRLALARLLLAKGLFDEAAAACTEALRINPDLSEARALQQRALRQSRPG